MNYKRAKWVARLMVHRFVYAYRGWQDNDEGFANFLCRKKIRLDKRSMLKNLPESDEADSSVKDADTED